jgi:hypothetical protein
MEAMTAARQAVITLVERETLTVTSALTLLTARRAVLARKESAVETRRGVLALTFLAVPVMVVARRDALPDKTGTVLSVKTSALWEKQSALETLCILVESVTRILAWTFALTIAVTVLALVVRTLPAATSRT